MLDSIYLAWKYLTFNKLKTTILIACITVVGSLPINLNLLLAESERQLMNRANSTPLVIGAKGSDLDLTINTLYFTSQPPEKINMADVSKIQNTKLAMLIPIYSQFKARDYLIIGTNLDYFSFRRLSLQEGRYFSILGDCVLGASVAKKLNLKVGDTIVSSPQNLFDLGGVYPLKMKVVGILKINQTADDLAIFTDLKTTWIIEGLGHGHLDLVNSIRQIIQPAQTIQELLLDVFKIRNLLNFIFIVVMFTTIIAIFLVFNLSLKLRQREMETNFYLGCSRSTTTQLIIAEILIIILISSTLTFGITLGIKNFNSQVIRALIL